MDSGQVPPASNGFISPHILDTDMDATMHETDMFFDSALAMDSSSHFFENGGSALSPFQSPAPVKAQGMQNQRRGVQNRSTPSLSSESSTQDSSSDSSDQRKSKSSSTSSRSVPSGSDTVMADVSEASQWSGSQPLFKKEPVLGFPQSDAPNFDSFEFSNRAMENDFDFDSAASSPSPLVSASNNQYTGPRCLTMPHGDSPKTSTSLLPNAAARHPMVGLSVHSASFL